MLYCPPVVLLLNLLHVTISWQHLHRFLFFVVLGVYGIGGRAGGFSLLKRVSLIFLGCLKATIGESGMAFFNLLEV